MAEEYHQQQSNICSQNWWISNSISTNNPLGRSSNRYESGIGADDALVEHDMNKVGMITLDDSVSISHSSSSMTLLNTNKNLPGVAPGLILSGRDGDAGGMLVDTNLQYMGLGLPSQGVERFQALLRGGKADQSIFRSMLEEDIISSSAKFQPEIQWKPSKIFTTNEEETPLCRSGFSLDQPQFSSPNEENSTITCHNLQSIYTENSQSVVFEGSPSSMHHSLLEPSNYQSHQKQAFLDQRGMDDYSYGSTNYGMSSNESPFMPHSSLTSDNKFPQFMITSPTKPQHSSQNQLQFSNNAPYWNASSARVMPPDVRANFMPSPQPQFPKTSTKSSFEEKPKNNIKGVSNKDSSVAAKKSGAEALTKRPRNESSLSPLPPFKVKKEKVGDRITALQQLVSPFGKTDTASVLSESIEYIKILHEQVLVLTATYMKNGAMTQHHHQHLEQSISRDSKGHKKDLRSRGLCLVHLSSTFPVTHETSVDFWNPTFGGPLR